MRLLLLKYWDWLGSSLWFVPALMVAASAGLSFASVALDQSLDRETLHALAIVYTGDAAGARSVLSAIASSMVTIVALVFSLILVALSLAASQFGPRLLRNFMRDTTTQVVLGAFVATFLYCLLVLRTIRSADGASFVPHLSVTLAIAMVLLSVGVLIYFIHHISVLLQADELVKRVGAELIERVDDIFPEQLGAGRNNAGSGAAGAKKFDGPGSCIRSRKDGYLQLVDSEALMDLATERDLVIEVERRPGDHVFEGTVLARVFGQQKPDEDLVDRLREIFVLGGERTGVQDIEFTMNQLVEVAVRALSPGLNDPFTAIACLDRLGSMLRRVARREMPSRCRYDQEQRLRVTAPSTTFSHLLNVAFDQIRHYGRNSFAVCLRLLETLAAIAAVAERAEDLAALAEHGARVVRAAREGLVEPDDLQVVECRNAELNEALARLDQGS